VWPDLVEFRDRLSTDCARASPRTADHDSQAAGHLSSARSSIADRLAAALTAPYTESVQQAQRSKSSQTATEDRRST